MHISSLWTHYWRSMDRETRTGGEITMVGDDNPTIAGYAVVFNSLSTTLYDWGRRPFVERVDPVAFSKWLDEKPDIYAFWNHSDMYPLGRTGNNTLLIQRDERGLRFELQPSQTSWGRDALYSISRGDVTGVSMGFTVSEDRWERLPDGMAMRTLLRAELYEISPTVYPAYKSTSVSVRAMVPWELRDLTEDDLRPTDGMIAEAERGLAWRDEYNRAGTDVGVARARDIVNNRVLSADTWRRMLSYFQRHAIDSEATGYRPGEAGYPSAGRIAWALWGGDPGYDRSRVVVSRLESDSRAAGEIQAQQALRANAILNLMQWRI
jgi:HK97 family phage prohead protease